MISNITRIFGKLMGQPHSQRLVTVSAPQACAQGNNQPLRSFLDDHIHLDPTMEHGT